MRMWNINVTSLCRQHLVGEHYEMHMFKGSIEKGIKLNGYLDKGLLDIGYIKTRHDLLANEMIRRGINHKSPMNKFNEGKTCNTTNTSKNIQELHKRCSKCKEIFYSGGWK